jgi:hypothetical protein
MDFGGTFWLAFDLEIAVRSEVLILQTQTTSMYYIYSVHIFERCGTEASDP